VPAQSSLHCLFRNRKAGTDHHARTIVLVVLSSPSRPLAARNFSRWPSLVVVRLNLDCQFAGLTHVTTLFSIDNAADLPAYLCARSPGR
jgi:hypothetical protein